MAKRILLVDDEDRIREIVRGYLESEGFEVSEARDGEAALDAARDWHPDLVVLDVMMPGTDGIEVLRKLRATSELPVILLTARSEEVDTLLGLSMGADDYVTKPFSPASSWRGSRRCCAGSRAARRPTRPTGWCSTA